MSTQTMQTAYTKRFGIIAASFAAAALLLPAHRAHAKTVPPSDPVVVAAKTTAKRTAVAKPQAAPRAVSRAEAPVTTVAGAAPGQAGYVHYFVITGPDGEPESQVGIELAGDLIAWSFPGLGVVVSPFIQRGSITSTSGSAYEVEHLYGIRPFPDDRSMRVLQQELASRVQWWLDEKTPYCDEEAPANRMCVSCLGFALRVLYPGAGPILPGLPADFKSARKNTYSTEDLLLYLAGIPIEATTQARLKRIAALAVPETMREELVRISGEVDAIRAAAAAKPPVKSGSARPVSVDLPKRVLTRRRS
jgi:hypothetical protein